jgi:hypothetical protein
MRWARAFAVVTALVWPMHAQGATLQVITHRAAASDMALDHDGTASLVISRRSVVWLRRAAPGAPFGPSKTLVRDYAVDAAVAVDGSGAIAMQRARSVEVMTFGARGRVGRSSVVSRRRTADFAALAVARGGAAIVVWFRHGRARRWRLEAAVRRPGARAFAAPEPLSRFLRLACCTHVSVALGERGDAVAVWRSTARPAVWASLRHAGDRFGPPQRLADDASDVPIAAAGADGTAAVMYSRQRVPARGGDGLRVHRAARDGVFGAAEIVNPGGGVTFGDAVVTPAGRLLVAWVDPSTARVGVSESAPMGPLVDAGSIATGAGPRAPVIAASDDGSAVVAWSQQVPSGPWYSEQAMAATRAANGTAFGPAMALGSIWRVAEPRAVGLVAGGGALAAWSGSQFGPARPPGELLAVTRLP